MEIGPSLKSLYPTNWELSKARATGVLRYLVEKGGIDSVRLSTIGYGATKPLTSNATEDGRSKNRRVEILLYSPDAAPASPDPATSPNEATADDGYRVSGLVPERQEPPAPVADGAVLQEVSPGEKSVPTPPVVSDTPPQDVPSVSSPSEKAAQP